MWKDATKVFDDRKEWVGRNEKKQNGTVSQKEKDIKLHLTFRCAEGKLKIKFK